MLDSSFPPTVLLVDDDLTARFLLRRLLHRQWPGVQVLEAENGAQGLALVEAHCQAASAPHSLLVLLDLNMPVLDGLGFLRCYQHLPGHCHQIAAVVVASNSCCPTELAQAHAQATELLRKPLVAEQLPRLLHQYLPSALAV